MINHKSQITNQKSQRSWHHRMARLIPDAYYPRCEASSCQGAAVCICEWDQDQNGKVVSRRKLYCAEHAAGFALKHRIYMADLPDVLLSQLETASRDGWKYSDDSHQDTKTQKLQSSSSCLSDFVADAQLEESR